MVDCTVVCIRNVLNGHFDFDEDGRCAVTQKVVDWAHVGHNTIFACLIGAQTINF
jgi:hypothetical protein